MHNIKKTLGIVNLFPLPLFLNQTIYFQDTQLMGNSGLCHAQFLRQFVHTEMPPDNLLATFLTNFYFSD